MEVALEEAALHEVTSWRSLPEVEAAVVCLITEVGGCWLPRWLLAAACAPGMRGFVKRAVASATSGRCSSEDCQLRKRTALTPSQVAKA